MASLSQDLRFGVRLLFRNPGHTLAAVLALGLGIGLATAMFSIVYGVLFRGLPVPEPDQILHIENANPALDQPSLEVFFHDFLDYRERQKSFEHLAGYYGGTLNLSGDGGQPERFNGTFLSANGFDLLRVQPVLGRGFQAGEDTPQAEPVVVLSYGVWRSRYQGDSKVLGKVVRINGQPGTIVGVMPEGFAFPESTEVWTPIRLDPMRIERGQGETLEVMGRLRHGITAAAARAEMVGLAKALAVEHPKTNEGRTAVVKPWMEEALGDEIPRLLWSMLGACIFVLLIACTNVASLMVARATGRTREIAIRASLGASRGRIILQLLLESLVLAAIGAVLGMLLARWGVQLFNYAIADTNPPFWIRIAVDSASLFCNLGLALVAALLSGLLPALQISRTEVGEVLKDEGRGSSSLRVGLFSRAVVVLEVAFSCLLLVWAGLMVRSVVSLKTVDLGFDPTRLFTARIALFDASYPQEAERVSFFTELLSRLETRPGVAAVAATTNLPGGGSGLWSYRVEGRAYATERDLPRARAALVSPGFFKVYRAQVQGREFGRLDTAASLPVVIVNRSFASKVWPGEDPLGKRIRLQEEPGEKSPPWRTVIGIAPDLQMAGVGNNGPSLNRPQVPEGFYIPLWQRCPGFVSLAVRTRSSQPMSVTAMVRREVNALDPDLPIYFVNSMEEILTRGRFFPNLFGTLFAIFGVAALLLAAGLAVGLLLALPGSQALASFLFGIQPRDPITFTLVSLVLALVAFIACWIPARRATQTDPLVAIRYD
jgi:putative ABC transport system permease protein